MNSDSRRKVMRLLKDNGYTPYRNVKHGELWKNSAGKMFLVARPTKTDDPRAYKNAKKVIERQVTDR